MANQGKPSKEIGSEICPVEIFVLFIADTSSDKPKTEERIRRDFVVTPEYRQSSPDIQNSGSMDMEGAHNYFASWASTRLLTRFVGPMGRI